MDSYLTVKLNPSIPCPALSAGLSISSTFLFRIWQPAIFILWLSAIILIRGEETVSRNEEAQQAQETADGRNVVLLSRVRLLRKKKRKTQTAMAVALEMNQGDYSKAERGLRTFTVFQVRALALKLGTSMDYLCGLTDDESPLPRAPHLEG